MNSVSKLLAKDSLLNHFRHFLRNENALDKVAILFSDQKTLANQKLANVKGHIFDSIFSIAEILSAIALTVILLPLMILIFVGVKLTSNGPGIYSQKRVGKHGHEFNIYKFRTMIQNAEKESGAVLSWHGDPRITTFGNFLRSTHLDELPQIINIIKGEMSFIGPRPERQEIIKTFEQHVKGYNHRAVVLPGITGLAQICCPYDATPETKLKYDLYYILNRSSISLNLMILYFTVGKFFYGISGNNSQT